MNGLTNDEMNKIRNEKINEEKARKQINKRMNE